MKKIVVAAFAALVAFGAFAKADDAAVANRKWVRKAIAEALGKKALDADVVTNANGTVTITSPFTSTNIPGAVSISMTFSANTNEALRVDNSTIPGMTNRTYYAYDYAQCGYMNTNAPVRAIYASKVVNTSVVTNYYTGEFSNHYWVVTNRVTETRFSATGTNGTAFVSFKTNGVYWIQAATNAAWKAKITRTKVSDANRSQLIGTPLAKTGRRFSLFDLLVPTAYADAPSGNGIADDGTITWTFTLDSIKIEIENDSPVTVDISDLKFEFSDTLPEKPDPTHTCFFNSDCYCEGYGLTPSDIENNSAYEASAATDALSSSMEFSSWMTEEQWKDAGGKISKKGRWYMEVEGGNFEIDPSEITGNDAWKKQMQSLTDAIADYLTECQENYKKSIICDSTEEMPCHDWYTQTCGGNTWKTCKRNSSHKEGSEAHEMGSTASSYNNSGHIVKCLCGKKSQTYAHTKTYGTKVPKTGNTGWTQHNTCTYSGCGWSEDKDHTCVHEYCATCSAGDDCTWACPTCNGSHKFEGKTESRCARCSCDGCGIKNGEQKGPIVVVNIDNHSGWESCSDHEDESNDKGAGYLHCLCECGYFNCNMPHSHSRECIEAIYEKIPAATGGDDPTEHYMINKSDCTKCGDPYGTREAHKYTEAEPYYEKIGADPESKCREVKVCDDCGYESKEDVEDAGDHSEKPNATTYERYEADGEDLCKKNMTCTNLGKGGTEHTYYDLQEHDYTGQEITKYEYVDDENCKPFKKCKNCQGEIEQECVAHVKEQNPSKYKDNGDFNGSGGGCVPVKKCTHNGNKGCNHEFDETAQAHVPNRTSAGKCKCSNCKTYQCDHLYNQTDACGNSSCACGEKNPSQEEQHINYVDAGNGKHHCGCGKITKSHTYGSWELTSSTSTKDNYTRICTLCGATQSKSVDKGQLPDSCTDDEHKPLPNACGCMCGYYTEGATYMNANGVACTGHASESEDFHKWNTDADATGSCAGYVNCTCKCGKKHKFRDWNGRGTHCNVCAYCKNVKRNGSAPTENDHEPKSGYCGCLCGALTPATANSVRFHPKSSTTCRCWGSNHDGNGRFHYPNTSKECPDVCWYRFNNVEHWANTGNQAEQSSTIPCGYDAHTPKTTGTCGCKCGVVSGDILTAAMTKFHIDSQSSCGCVCQKIETPHRYRTSNCRCDCYLLSGGTKGIHNKRAGANGACPLVCHGDCGESTKTKYKYLSLHEPNILTCGCKCGSAGDASVFTPVDMYAEFHSHPNPSRTCWCYNMCKHRFAKPDPDCTSVCTNFNCMGRVDTGADRDSPSIHTFVTNNVGYCGCECGRKVDQKHRHGETNCYCYAKNAKSVSHPRKDMNHQWVLTNRQLIGEESECDICGTISAKYALTYTCKRCGITEAVEKFYGCNCHASEQGECGCTTCTCSFCKAGTGYCTTCWKQCRPTCKARQSKKEDEDNTEDDGNTDGSHDPRDIL